MNKLYTRMEVLYMAQTAAKTTDDWLNVHAAMRAANVLYQSVEVFNDLHGLTDTPFPESSER